jgi:hypothetical protein
MKNILNQKIFRVSSIIDKPSAIESLYNLEKYKLLAVGRSDNSIEIWNTDTWVQLVKIQGTQSNQIRRVFMIKKKDTVNLFDNLRLFSVGMNGYLIEWSLITMDIKVFKYYLFIYYFRIFTKILEDAFGMQI